MLLFIFNPVSCWSVDFGCCVWSDLPASRVWTNVSVCFCNPYFKLNL